MTDIPDTPAIPFGPHLTHDPINRLDVQAVNLPEYHQISHDIRTRLLTNVVATEWPPLPASVQSMDDLFSSAETLITTHWNQGVTNFLRDKRTEWLNALPTDNDDYAEARMILGDEALFEEKLRYFQLGSLEVLRGVSPEDWREIYLASSERQLALIALLNHWIKMPNNQLANQLNMQPAELKLMIELAAVMGKHFNVAFLKQIELADQPGGSSETPLSGNPGVARLYDFARTDSDDVILKSFKEIFPAEFTSIEKHFARLAKKVRSQVSNDELPASYNGLADLLDKMSVAYGSDEKNPEALDQIWNDLDRMSFELNAAGCPLTIIGQACAGVAGDANKIDIEMRLGWQDARSRKIANALSGFQETAQAWLTSQKPESDDSLPIPHPNVSRQLFAFGTNLIWETPADTRMEVTNLHPNTIAKEGRLIRPLLRRTFLGANINDDDFETAFVTDTGLHEMAHGLFTTEDPRVLEKIGVGSEADVLEELKAEIGGMMILANRLSTLPEEETNVVYQNQFEAKLGVILDYLVNKSGEEGSFSERYYYCGVGMIDELLHQNVLIQEDAGYRVVDPKKGIQVLAKMGLELIERFYHSETTDPSKVDAYVHTLRAKNSDPLVQSFLSVIRDEKF